ncbi:MAG: 4-hydroxy-3-methylbut-2-enyl diphosphate reductase [Gammaproteobacteria bacterium]|nr:4-hydroxy-3-methylbut-2-enyl diphosphate reductase [Gammaproteobacteria bacterium]NIR83041.1 4-hydroxy-3-methylbut-2-enyl diphosphate reductase [Gammaproteobacteria bacterium]NIR90703.1 4-hydroxy-3-methylbut-2-enyl diphosphate reductase [Gammaproteobacteria bacterium]NIU04194.1 4-hydroxy-3-methylbut-2-enyl diphosphate reductase [Gammaproteobacteria bacterium]NIV51486.1 4-hydroxy-3-methylbut-2-enyl diphosphate reductase [Gammaproteobacteria bacterium]
MEVILAQPRGFCAGVVRAVDVVEQALALYDPPVYVLHEIVHNRHVVEDLKKRGAIFVEFLHEVPVGAVCIFSAHGVSNEVVRQARERRLEVIDATCPLVSKVHLESQRYSERGYELIIIGHAGHPEVEGTRGRIRGPVHVIGTEKEAEQIRVQTPERLAYVTQTTLSLDDTRAIIGALKRRFPGIEGPDVRDICYATQNRQNAVRRLAQEIDLLLVVGARNSSNSNRLREVGEQCGVEAHLVESPGDLDGVRFAPEMKIGVTAGASAPEVLVEGVVNRLRELGAEHIRETDGERENVSFRVPVALLRKRKSMDARKVESAETG